MPATAARIAFVTQATRAAEVTDAAVKGVYGSLARDTGADPVETFFDNATDATAMATERLTLLKANRRRFVQRARGGSLAQGSAPGAASPFFGSSVFLWGSSTPTLGSESGSNAGGGVLNFSQKVPTVTVIDDDRSANHSALVVSIKVDFEKNVTELETWG